jgi:holo-[acyl-carrier protein] synthase
MIRTGIDLVEIARLEETLQRHGRRFLERIYTQQELAEVGENLASLAARFAAKEAVAKTLCTGIGLVGWKEIEIMRGPQREPVLKLHGQAAALAGAQGLTEWSLSLSHTRHYAVAVAVAVSQGVGESH